MDKWSTTYAEAGVNYDAMDPFKVEAQAAAQQTDCNLVRFGFWPVGWSRGESVFLIGTPIGDIGMVVEGLGTKNLVADTLCFIAKQVVRPGSHRTFYDQIAQCNVAMAVNDLITLGARPVVYGQYLAVGSDDWFENKERRQALIEGTKKACQIARCTWGGGETPTLKDIIIPGTVDLAGATFGIVPRGCSINPAHITDGDEIVLIESSGIHANGLTLARKIADKLPDGYQTEVPGTGRTYGEVLLDPTHIYVKLVEDCQNAGVFIRYAVNITGHGWRKLMRASSPFVYVIETLPPSLPIFEFIQKHGPINDREMYGNYNMGAGFALYVPEEDVLKVIRVAKANGLGAYHAGHIERRGDQKKVVIKPKGLEYVGDTLRVR